MKRMICLIGLLLGSWMAGSLFASEPSRAFVYQAIGRTADASPIMTPVTLTFELKQQDAAQAETLLWTGKTDPATVTPDSEGVVRVLVVDESAETPYEKAVQSSEGTLLLYITVSGTGITTYTVTQKLLPAPYAVYAKVAEESIGDFVVATGSVEAKGESTLGDFQCETLTTKTLTVDGTLSAKEIKVMTSESAYLGQFPIGTVMPWDIHLGKTLPEGWALCDGSNGTIDLRARLVYGVPEGGQLYAIGGEETHTLTRKELPSHTHKFNNSNDEPRMGDNPELNLESNVYIDWVRNDSNIRWGTDSVYYETKEFGAMRNPTNSNASAQTDQPHQNLPPYMNILYIQRIR